MVGKCVGKGADRELLTLATQVYPLPLLHSLTQQHSQSASHLQNTKSNDTQPQQAPDHLKHNPSPHPHRRQHRSREVDPHRPPHTPLPTQQIHNRTGTSRQMDTPVRAGTERRTGRNALPIRSTTKPGAGHPDQPRHGRPTHHTHNGKIAPQ